MVLSTLTATSGNMGYRRFSKTQREVVQKVLSTDSVASRVDEYRRNLNLNVGEMAFPPTLVEQIRRASRPTFWTASEISDGSRDVTKVSISLVPHLYFQVGRKFRRVVQPLGRLLEI